MAAPAREADVRTRLDADEGRREELRRDPGVVVRQRRTRDPFVSGIRVARPVDVLDLIGRRDDEDTGTETDAPAHRRA